MRIEKFQMTNGEPIAVVCEQVQRVLQITAANHGNDATCRIYFGGDDSVVVIGDLDIVIEKLSS